MDNLQAVSSKYTIPRLPAFGFGGDYNPEQWTTAMGYADEAIWKEDMRLMKLAGVNLVTVGVFSWVSLQPDEHTFTFDWLDRIMNLLAEQGIFACLATPTAAHPAWLSAAYPEALLVDEEGRRRAHSFRSNYCPTNPDFRRLAQNLVRALAERYRDHAALALWHVNNEYGPVCYCAHCASRFRVWLQERYGSLEEVNRTWVTPFWSHTYTAWEQIEPPGRLADHSIQGLVLDYRHFLSQMNLECFRQEADILRAITPDIPVTTNFWGMSKHPNQAEWAPYLDVIAWDSYPLRSEHPSTVSFRYDLMRGLKNGQSWLLMEQTPSQVNWSDYNSLKRPGVMRQQSYQCIAHGADSVLFFQWRQPRASYEMFHGAIVSHAGHEHTRVFSEVAALGQELAALDTGILGTQVPARVALLFSWPNWWSVEYRPSPSRDLQYLDEVLSYYRALWENNVAIDVISPDQNLRRYDLVVAPLLHMVSQAQGEAIENYVRGGGVFLTTFFSGVVDEHNRAWLGGYPGPLRRALGIWVEEFDPLEPEMTNTLRVPEGGLLPPGSYACGLWCDLLHLEGATALATYGSDFYAGRPAITEHPFGQGRALYIATRPDYSLQAALVKQLLAELSISAPLVAPAGVEVTQRVGTEGAYTFLLNHTGQSVKVSLPHAMQEILTRTLLQDALELPPTGVAILRDARQ
jgi:beta-galactosidase